MKTRVQFSNIRIKQHPKHRVTVCTLWANPNIWYIDNKVLMSTLTKVLLKPEFKHLDRFGRFDVTAVTRCSILDDFDEEKGKKIAILKAKYKAFKVFFKLWKAIMKELNKDSEEAEQYMYACFNAAMHEDKYFNKIMEE